MRGEVPPLGIGFPYLPSAPSALYAEGLLNFVEVAPDALCRRDEQLELSFDPALLNAALEVTAGLPTVVHGVELSIGSAHAWNASYVDILDQFAQLRPFVWHSEHSGFLRALDLRGRLTETGVPLPLPFTCEAANLVSARAHALLSRYGVPFLLENAVHYLPELPTDAGWDEVQFLNEVSRQSGCGLLLDLFNLHCNARHHRFSVVEALDRLVLERVMEIHIAGGATHEGFLLDSHSAIVPEAVWNLLEEVLPRTPRLRGIVFEVLVRRSRVSVSNWSTVSWRERGACGIHMQSLLGGLPHEPLHLANRRHRAGGGCDGSSRR